MFLIIVSIQVVCSVVSHLLIFNIIEIFLKFVYYILDVNVDHPDAKCIMLYIASYFKVFPHQNINTIDWFFEDISKVRPSDFFTKNLSGTCEINVNVKHKFVLLFVFKSLNIIIITAMTDTTCHCQQCPN